MFNDDDRRTQAKIIARIIRKNFGVSNTRKQCFVCGGYASISEKHHLISVSEIVALWLEMKIKHDELNRLTVPTIWLCPNHHTLFHALDGASDERIEEIATDMSAVEAQVIGALIKFREEKRAELMKFLNGADKYE